MTQNIQRTDCKNSPFFVFEMLLKKFVVVFSVCLCSTSSLPGRTTEGREPGEEVFGAGWGPGISGKKKKNMRGTQNAADCRTIA